MLGVWLRRREPWRRIGGARGGGFVGEPLFVGEMRVRRAFRPVFWSSLHVSVYGVPVASKQRRMCSPRPGMVGQ